MRYLTTLLFAALTCLISVCMFGQSPCNNQTSVTHQGYEYDIVEIGNQCWFSENCRYLPVVSSSSASSPTSPYYYVYGYEGSDVEAAKSTDNYESYGVLYNWPAVMTEGICPSGWHISTDEEYTELTDFLGGEAVAGGKMKEAGYDHWDEPNYGATNSSGWTGLPGGFLMSGGFHANGDYGDWWSASESDGYSWKRHLDKFTGSVNRSAHNHFNGFSARCVRDYSTTSSVPTEPSSNRKLEKVIDALGREVNHTTNQILFHIYDDGSVEKKFIVE
jgi:uncharacterized protein (TIGR02145 family)